VSRNVLDKVSIWEFPLLDIIRSCRSETVLFGTSLLEKRTALSPITRSPSELLLFIPNNTVSLLQLLIISSSGNSQMETLSKTFRDTTRF
jgi:hypothetical protein